MQTNQKLPKAKTVSEYHFQNARPQQVWSTTHPKPTTETDTTTPLTLTTTHFR